MAMAAARLGCPAPRRTRGHDLAHVGADAAVEAPGQVRSAIGDGRCLHDWALRKMVRPHHTPGRAGHFV